MNNLESNDRQKHDAEIWARAEMLASIQ